MDDTKSPTLTWVVEPTSFFHDLVCQAMEAQRLRVQPETELYLVQLLQRFMNADNLFVRDSEGRARQEPLALLLKEALEEQEREHQRLLFRHLGDLSLYTAGFFPDSLVKKSVDVDYYIDMGGTAYRAVASRSPELASRGLFREMSDRFSSLVEVLAEVSQKTTPKTEVNLLRIYESWQKNGGQHNARALKEAGILPGVASKKTGEIQ